MATCRKDKDFPARVLPRWPGREGMDLRSAADQPGPQGADRAGHRPRRRDGCKHSDQHPNPRGGGLQSLILSITHSLSILFCLATRTSQSKHDPELVEAISNNTVRYASLFAEAVSGLLPEYKQREVMARDSLDVYIEHRLLLHQQHRGEAAPRDPRNIYPLELLRRL